MLNRPSKGRNLAGMDSQVTRPMITTFCKCCGDVLGIKVVTCLKKAMSLGSRHGRPPLMPIPYVFVAATISVYGFILKESKDEEEKIKMACLLTDKATRAGFEI